MTTAFGTQPRVCGSRFFPPTGRPVCAFTRAELARMRIERVNKEEPPLDVGAAIAHRDRKIHRIDGTVALIMPDRDKQAFICAAKMFGVSVAEILGNQRSRILAVARKYLAHRLVSNGRPINRIAVLMKRDHTTVMHHLGLIKSRRPHKQVRALSTAANPRAGHA